MNKLPKKIFISIGGFSGSTYTLEFDGKELLYSHSGGGCPGEGVNIPLPSEEQWVNFSQELDNLKIWEWEEAYYNFDILDGTQWEITIIYDSNKKIISNGSNEYPKDFDKFLKSVSKLIDGLEFG